MRIKLSLLALLIACSCNSQDITDTDPIDASIDGDIDSDGDVFDGLQACGSLSCDAATEICVGGPKGPTVDYACETVPGQCTNDRTCDCLSDLFCGEYILQCTDNLENELFCENGSQ
jgi:hypothetical protein